jgi:Rieske Fe-S protein
MTDEDPEISRKSFLKIATLALGGLMSAVLAIPAVSYIVGPSLQTKSTQEWIRLGSVRKVETGSPTLFKTKIERRSGWIANELELSVYILTVNGSDFVAISNICTHLGCRVRWITDQQQFFCPCHNGIFDKEGKVLAGPPPRPLDRYEVKIENDQVFILVG